MLRAESIRLDRSPEEIERLVQSSAEFAWPLMLIRPSGLITEVAVEQKRLRLIDALKPFVELSAK